VIRMLATLAHDCRRTELFQSELIAALRAKSASHCCGRTPWSR
jgi:membrane-bound lytic murein transglycosylase B